MRLQRWWLVLLCALAPAAQAQMRTIPGEAKAGELRHVHERVVAIDGVERRLAPGAQIRDQANRIVLPASVPAGSSVKYLLDPRGEVQQVWILTAKEAAEKRAD